MPNESDINCDQCILSGSQGVYGFGDVSGEMGSCAPLYGRLGQMSCCCCFDFCQATCTYCGADCIGPVSGSPAGTLTCCANCYCGEQLSADCAPTCGGPDRGGSVYCSQTGVTTPAPCGCQSLDCWMCKMMCCDCCKDGGKGAGSAPPTKAGSGGGAPSGGGGGGAPKGGSQGQQQTAAQQAALTSTINKLGSTLSQAVSGLVQSSKAILGTAKTKTATVTGSGDMWIVVIVVLILAGAFFMSRED